MEHAIKLGIIGCGLAARNLHWPALQALKDKFVITAVCNHHVQKAEDFAARIALEQGSKPEVFADWQDLVACPDVEAVDVILPVELNLPVCRGAVQAGKHVLVEKPLAENLPNARAMVELSCSDPGLVFAVAENFRYRQIYEYIKHEMHAGTIGQPLRAEWRCWQKVDPRNNDYARTAWRIDHQYEGGFVTDAGVHYVAALRELFGEIRFCSGEKYSVNPGIGRTDMLSARWRAGAVDGILALGFSVHSPWHDELLIIGSAGTVTVNGSAVTLQRSVDGQIVTGRMDFGTDNGYEGELEDFHRAITRKKVPISTAQKAYGDLETILAFLAGSQSR